MGMTIIFIFCSLAVFVAQGKVTFEADRPSLTVAVFQSATLECCFRDYKGEYSWIKHRPNNTYDTIERHDKPTAKADSQNIFCGTLVLPPVMLNDSGMYACFLDNEGFTHGTYLQVYKPVEKMINVSESTKNKILTVEGILLLLCVLGPSVSLLFKSKRLNELEKKKMQKEEENIYQGLNLDDCCTTYDQIERSQAHGPYQDVGNIKEEGEDIQLEKP